MVVRIDQRRHDEQGVGFRWRGGADRLDLAAGNADLPLRRDRLVRRLDQMGASDDPHDR